MYAGVKIDWNKGTVKNVRLAAFSQAFKNVFGRSATVQATHLTKLFMIIFTTEPEDKDDNTPLNPLNRLMSLVSSPQSSRRDI
jgi:hypothetical protein